MEAAESRFAQLLKPIRELTQNWEVDLASQLGDYLHEVSSPGGDAVTYVYAPWKGSVNVCFCLTLMSAENVFFSDDGHQ